MQFIILCDTEKQEKLWQQGLQSNEINNYNSTNICTSNSMNHSRELPSLRCWVENSLYSQYSFMDRRGITSPLFEGIHAPSNCEILSILWVCYNHSPSLSCDVILQDAITLWDNEAVDGKEKMRHVFLFPDQMVMTKPSKSANIEEYEYKNTCQVCTLILN